ncbi:MAG: helix-turn-helix transcriptional regulator [Oscillospiraceae bacterium]|nr:helix-turn-helix transcriptional regulator [Oscillospiraceae bacterium]
MKVDREKLKLAMARACMNTADLIAATKMPEPTVKNVITGRSVRPATLGHVARALNVDPSEIIEQEGLLCNRQ